MVSTQVPTATRATSAFDMGALDCETEVGKLEQAETMHNMRIPMGSNSFGGFILFLNRYKNLYGKAISPDKRNLKIQTDNTEITGRKWQYSV